MGDYPTLRPAVTLGVLLRCGSVILSVHSTAVVMVNAMEKKRLATVKLMDVHVAMVCAMMVKIPIIVPKTANVIIMVSAKTGETPAACSLDCSCGNYKCEPELGETVSTCEHDCGCNRNFICESHENYEHCPEDCT